MEDSFYGEVKWTPELGEELKKELITLSKKFKISKELLLSKTIEIINPSRNTTNNKQQRNPNDPLSNKGKRWTDDEDAKMNELFKNKVPLKDIVKELKRTEGAILTRYGNQLIEKYPKLSLESIIKKSGLKLSDDDLKIFVEHFNKIKEKKEQFLKLKKVASSKEKEESDEE